MDRPVLLTCKEYAHYRRVSLRTVERWLAKRELPAERTGDKGHWRIRVWRCLSDTEPANEHVFSTMGMCD
jgi:excisionase family DNA binding protein